MGTVCRAVTVALAAAASLGLADPAAAAVSATAVTSAPTFDGPVYASVYSGDTIYVGGSFTHAVTGGVSVSRLRLAAFNAVTGQLLDWRPGADGTVRALAVAGSTVYIGGEFTHLNGIARRHLAAASTAGTVSAFAADVPADVRTLTTGNGRLYVGGLFTVAAGAARANLAAFSLSTGALDGTWRPVANGEVDGLTFAGTRVYAGGKFRQLNGVVTGRLGALDPTTGAVVPDFKPSTDIRVWGVAFDSAGVYAAMAGQGGRVIAFSPAGAKRWEATADGDVQTIALLDGVVYLGGHYDRVCKTTRTGDKGVCLDGSVSRVKLAAVAAGDGHLLDWAPQANGVHGTFTLSAGTGSHSLVAGGEFTTLGGVSRPYLGLFHS